MEEAESLLDTTKPAAIEKAKRTLAEGNKVIAKRQKLIRIADRSEHSWKTAEEYEQDPVASESDDEKRKKRAEKAAERKAEKTRKSRSFPPIRGVRGSLEVAAGPSDTRQPTGPMWLMCWWKAPMAQFPQGEQLRYARALPKRMPSGAREHWSRREAHVRRVIQCSLYIM